MPDLNIVPHEIGSDNASVKKNGNTYKESVPNVGPESSHPSIWSGFYKKALVERQDQLRLAFPRLFGSLSDSLTANSTSLNASGSDRCSPLLGNSVSSNLIRSVASQSAKLDLSTNTLDSSIGLVHAPDDTFPLRGLEPVVADHMVENCIGTMGLPIGLALNFVIDGIPIVVPMAVEEPSVVAAVSGAAKILSSNDSIGFRTKVPERNIITAQVLLLNIDNARIDKAIQLMESKKSQILDVANQYCVNMHKRGGGAVDMVVRKVKRTEDLDSTTTAFLTQHLPPTKLLSTPQPDLSLQPHNPACWLVVHIHIDVCDAMGANCASTVAEGIAPVLVDLCGPGTRAGLKIVSNLNPSRLSSAFFRVPVSAIAYKGFSGAQVASRMIEAYQWARDDEYRATTHNKGIMNGIDAVALATGQDWRAVEAACHSWAAGNGRSNKSLGYSSMTRYWIEQDPVDKNCWYMCGELSLPLIVGTKGGVLATSSIYYYTLGLMGFPNSKRLASVMCCVGLAQNFAALRALSTEGIQRGHMHLHARNISIAAGASTHAIPEVTAWMIEKCRISVDAAREYVIAHHLFVSLRHKLSSLNQDLINVEASGSSTPFKPPSMLYYAESHDKPVTLNIAFQTLGESPMYMDFTDIKQKSPEHAVLFGDKTYEWLMQVLKLVDTIKLPMPIGTSRTTDDLTHRLKTISLILSVLVRRLMLWCPEETRSFVDKIFSHTRATQRIAKVSTKSNPSSPTRSNGKRLPISEKRPSIARLIQGLLDQAARYSQQYPIDSASDFMSVAEPQNSNPLNSSNTHSNSALDWTPASVDWKLPDSGIFRSDLFDDELHLKDPKTLANNDALNLISQCSEGSLVNTPIGSTEVLNLIPTKRQILQVGFPLVLGVWQVFEIWVTQHVASGCPILAAAILEEQRLVVSALVSSLNDVVPSSLSHLAPYLSVPPDNDLPNILEPRQVTDLFKSAFYVQAKRTQCSLFLLIDLMALDPRQISIHTITAIKATGWVLEHEASVANDAARLTRDYQTKFGIDRQKPNSGSGPEMPVRSPDSPQLQFRRKSLFRAECSAAHRERQVYRDPGDEFIAFHVDNLHNSMLTFAVLHLHADGHSTQSLTLEHVNKLLPKYLAAVDINGLSRNVERILGSDASTLSIAASGCSNTFQQTDVATMLVVNALTSGYFKNVSKALQTKLGVYNTLSGNNNL